MHQANLILDLQALYQNAKQVVDQTRGKVIAVVKNDAYHFGLRLAIQTFYQAGIRFFATTSLREAQMIRQEYENVEILLINPCQDFDALRRNRIQGNIPSLQFVEEFKDQMQGIVWQMEWAGLMRRSGARNIEEAINIITQIKKNDLNLAGLWTHFAWADEISGLYEEERDTWMQVRKILKEYHEFTYIHSQNSASFIRESGLLDPDDWARLGIYLYGCLPYADAPVNLRHAITLEAHVINIIELDAGQAMGYSGSLGVRKECTKVAVINIGYGDGILRNRVKTKGDPKGKVVRINQGFYELGNLMMSHCLALVDETVTVGDRVIFYDEKLPVHFFTQKGVGANSEQISALNHQSLCVTYLPVKVK